MNTNQNQTEGRNVRYYQAGSGGGAQMSGGAQAAQGHSKNRTLRNSLIVLLCIIVSIVALGAACSHMFGGDSQTRLPSRSYIAVVYVEGVITRGNVDSWGIPFGYQHDWLINEIDRLMNDSNNQGIILYINSPGGGVYESDALYLKLVEFRETTGRPIFASMSSMGASGAYYVASVADRIYANRNNWTGSIGVTIGTLIDVSELLENHGIRTETIVSGEHKAIGNLFDPLTQEQTHILQALVDEAHDQFVNIIAYERDMDIERVRELADGRIYTANQALELGLIDAIGNFSDAKESMKDAHNLHGSEIVSIRYVHSSLLANFFAGVNLRNLGASGDTAAILSLLERQNRSPVSYLCPILANWI
jgi:protease-4